MAFRTRFSNPCCMPPRVVSIRKRHSQRHVYPIELRHASIRIKACEERDYSLEVPSHPNNTCHFVTGRPSCAGSGFIKRLVTEVQAESKTEQVQIQFCSIDSVHEFAEQLRIHKICLLVVGRSVRSLWYSFPEVKLLWYPPFSQLQRIQCLIDLLKKKNKKLCA